MKENKITLLTVGSKEDIHNFKECVKSQAEWAIWHNIKHELVVLKKSKIHDSWKVYEAFVNHMIGNPDETVIVMIPSVMVLEFHANPFQYSKNIIIVNAGDIAVLTGFNDGSLVNRLNLLHSLSFKDVKHSSCDLGLHVLSTKSPDLVHFMSGISGKPEFVCTHGGPNSHGYELHAKTYVGETPGIKYNWIYNQSQFYKGGDFAVNLSTANYMLSQGFIIEFTTIRNRVKELIKEISAFEKDVIKPKVLKFTSEPYNNYIKSLGEIDKKKKKLAKAETEKAQLNIKNILSDKWHIVTDTSGTKLEDSNVGNAKS